MENSYDFNTINETKKKIILYEKEIYRRFLENLRYKKNLYYVPWRSDTTASLALYKSKYTDKIMWKDLAYGDYGDVISFLFYMKIKIFDEEILNIINQEKEKEPELEISDSPKLIQYTTRNFTENDLNYWNKYCINKEQLEKYKVQSLKQIFVDKELFKTLRVDSLGYVYSDKDKIRLYFPKNKKNKKHMTNNQNLSIGLKTLKEKYNIIEAPIFVITKSLKDVMCLDVMGIPATEIGSESIVPSQDLINEIREFSRNGNKPSDIIVITDGDEAGIVAAQKINKKYAKDNNINAIPFFKNKDAKDISDFVESFGLTQAKLAVLDIFDNYLPPLNYLFLKVSNETIEKLNNLPLLVSYGTLRYNQGNSTYRERNKEIVRFLEEVPLLGYKMYSMGGFPGVIKTYDPKYSIVSDLWVIKDKESLMSLDRLEGHPHFYHREKVLLNIQNIETGEVIVKDAFTYVILDRLNNSKTNFVFKGDWINMKNNYNNLIG